MNAAEPLFSPESQGIPSTEIIEYLDACDAAFRGSGGCMHGFVVRRHGKVVAEGSWSPFDTLRHPHSLHSHSKAFTSTAIGLVVDDGHLDINERLVDIFPEYAPPNPSENLKQLRVRDLLTMNTGAPKDHILGHGLCEGVNWVRGFLAKDFENKPGCSFKYDSDATYVLAAIVEKRTGRRMMDFLRERLFSKIGIENTESYMSPDGIPCGGWGMRMTTREISRFGQLYLDKGRWNDECVISREWTELATARHTWSGWANVGPQSVGAGTDWEQGYGFQFWRCHHDCYRADGAAGQYTIVVPDKDAVISVNASVSDMQKEMDVVFDIILPAMREEPLPEDPASLARLRERCASLAIPPLAKTERTNLPFDGKVFKFKPNPRKIDSVCFAADGDGEWTCSLVTETGTQRFHVGNGRWAEGEITVNPPELDYRAGYCDDYPLAAGGTVDDNGVFHLVCHFTRDTNRLDLDVIPSADGNFTVNGGFWGMSGTPLASEIIDSR